MARGDGIDRTNARNMRLTETRSVTPSSTTSVRRIPMSIRTLYWSGRRSMSISKPRLPGIERCLLEWRLMA